MMMWGLGESCAVAGCGHVAVDRVTVYPDGRWAESRRLCKTHAEKVRAWAEREGLDRPVVAWLPGLAARPPCEGCGARRLLFRRELCRACYKQRRRAA